jgi:hypothetical protein
LQIGASFEQRLLDDLHRAGFTPVRHQGWRMVRLNFAVVGSMLSAAEALIGDAPVPAPKPVWRTLRASLVHVEPGCRRRALANGRQLHLESFELNAAHVLLSRPGSGCSRTVACVK